MTTRTYTYAHVRTRTHVYIYVDKSPAPSTSDTAHAQSAEGLLFICMVSVTTINMPTEASAKIEGKKDGLSTKKEGKICSLYTADTKIFLMVSFRFVISFLPLLVPEASLFDLIGNHYRLT